MRCSPVADRSNRECRRTLAIQFNPSELNVEARWTCVPATDLARGPDRPGHLSHRSARSDSTPRKPGRVDPIRLAGRLLGQRDALEHEHSRKRLDHIREFLCIGHAQHRGGPPRCPGVSAGAQPRASCRGAGRARSAPTAPPHTSDGVRRLSASLGPEPERTS